MPRQTSRPLTQKLIDTTPLPARGARPSRPRAARLGDPPLAGRNQVLVIRIPVAGHRQESRLGLPAGTLTEARVIAKSHRALVALGAIPPSKPRRTSKSDARRTRKR